MKTIRFISIALLTLTFDLHGQPTVDWTSYHDGGSNLTDRVIDIVQDNQCNTYVTGVSGSIGQGFNIVTIKYDLSGAVLWANQFDGPDHLDDIPTDLFVDASGNVYVCGRSQSAATSFDFVTLKYLPDGSMAPGQWPAFYNNGNANGNGYDGAKSICVSVGGSVYVAGESFNHYSGMSQEDIMVLKYDANGNQIASTSGMNVNNRDFMKQIDFDKANKLFLLTYDSFGGYTSYWHDTTLQTGNNWSTQYGNTDEPTNFTVDQANNKYYAMNQANGFSIVKQNGNFNVWHPTYRRTGSSTDEVKSITTDDAGNTYVAASTTSSGEADFWLLKVNTNGDTIWTKTWGAGNGANDVPVKILGMASYASLVMIGNSTASNVNTIVTLRLDTAGNVMNNYPLLYPSDYATTGTRDVFGNLFVGGYGGSSGIEDFLTLKYATNNYSTSVINVMGDSLAVVPGDTTYQYQWYRNDTMLVGETSQGISLDTSINYLANYHCDVLQYCTWYSSDSLPFTVGIEDVVVEDSGITLFPNPAEGQVTLNFHRAILGGEIRILSQFGTVLYAVGGITMNAHENWVIDFELAPGIYLTEFKDKNGSMITKKLIVQ